MRWRTSLAWALAGGVGLAVLLLLACHPGLPVVAAAGMSAPSAPATSFESAPVAQLQQLKFDWHTPASVAQGFTFTLTPVDAAHASQQGAAAAPPHYGPLHRRPPPSLS